MKNIFILSVLSVILIACETNSENANKVVTNTAVASKPLKKTAIIPNNFTFPNRVFDWGNQVVDLRIYTDNSSPNLNMRNNRGNVTTFNRDDFIALSRQVQSRIKFFVNTKRNTTVNKIFEFTDIITNTITFRSIDGVVTMQIREKSGDRYWLQEITPDGYYGTIIMILDSNAQTAEKLTLADAYKSFPELNNIMTPEAKAMLDKAITDISDAAHHWKMIFFSTHN
ncbi:MAG: hypothetical protein ACRCTJ_02875 [Brevinema sp.]